MIWLNDRKILQISGDDAKSFLQGLITNDINLLETKNLIYSANLNANGKYFADFFIFKKKENYFLDCHLHQIEEIAKKFNFFKLRANVEIKIRDDFKVFFMNEVGEQDPRIDGFGYRLYDEKNQITPSKASFLIKYHEKRIFQKLPEGYYDLTPDKSYIAEYGFDEINAVSYQKGCYV
ncbi:MAG: YgfZ/GcvT domain-containing protein, partial [Alphaproteobacteria bacterium]